THQALEVEQAGKKKLSLPPAFFAAGRLRRARASGRARERPGDRLLAIDVLARRDRPAQELGAQLGRGGIEEERVLAALERGGKIGGPARDGVRLGELRELCLVAPDEDRIGHDRVPILEPYPALRPDPANRPDPIL